MAQEQHSKAWSLYHDGLVASAPSPRLILPSGERPRPASFRGGKHEMRRVRRAPVVYDFGLRGAGRPAVVSLCRRDACPAQLAQAVMAAGKRCVIAGFLLERRFNY